MSNFRRFLSSVFPASAVRRTPAGYRLQIETLEARVVPASLVVSSLEDTVRIDGRITLREAILSANANAPVNADVPSGNFGRDTIDIPASLVGTLNLTAPLPSLSDNNGLVINGNARFVINAAGAGSAPVVVNSANNEVRGLTIQASPSSGIVLNPGARNTVVAGNRIGTNADGVVVPGSGNAGSGIVIAGASSTTVNGNIVGGNSGAGVSVTGNSTGYSVLGNIYQGNGGPAIDVGGDGAGTTASAPASRTASPIVTQVVPTSAAVRTAYGTAFGVSGSTQRLEFYTATAFDANGLAQGQTMVGTANVVIGPSGTGPFAFTYAPVAGQAMLTATATDSAGNTSEFSGRNRAPSITSPAERTLPTGASNLVFEGANAFTVVDPGNTGTGPVRARVYSTNGTVTLGNFSGVGIETGTNGSTGVTITGTLAGVNRALAGLTFTPASGFSGRATVGVRVDDFGGDALGGTLSVERNTFITVPTATTPPNPGGTVVAAPIVTVSPASGNVGSPIALNISVTLATNNGTDRINTIGIKNLPTGATLSAGTRLSDGSWLLTPAQLAGLTITSPTAGSFDLSVSATTRTTLNDSINATTKALTLTVVTGNPGGTVVAAPIVTVSPASGNVGSPIALNITVTLANNNGTDRINTIGIKNLPTGATLSAGTRLSDGSWLLTPAQLTGLTITSPTSGTFDLSVSATTRTTLNDSINATTKALTLTVGNVVPVVSIGTSGSTFPRDVPATFTGSFTDVESQESVWIYTWTVVSASGQSVAPKSGKVGIIGDVPGFAFTPTAGGQYTITLTVRDAFGATGSATRVIGVETAEPVATITAGPTSTAQGQPVTFSGTVGSPLANAGPFTYVWTATPPTGAAITAEGRVDNAGGVPDFRFTPGPGGNWAVTLRVRDASGTQSQPSTRSLSVTNVAPVAVIASGPGSVNEGETATYTGSFSDPAGIAAGGYFYLWTVTGPDGQRVTSKSDSVGADGSIPSFSVAPPRNGRFTVSLAVVDRERGSNIASRELTVIDIKPTVTIVGAASLVSGQSATYTGSFTDPGADGPYSYEWTLTAPGKAPLVSNGTLLNGQPVPVLTFTGTDVGSYAVSLTIRDRDGNSTTQSRLVTVTTNTPPITSPPLVTIVGPATGVEGSPLTFRGIQLDNTQVTSTPTYTWTVTSTNGQAETVTGSVGSSFRVPDFILTPNDNGTYTVSLTVTRGGVTSAPDSIVVEVSNVAPMPTILTGTQTVAIGSAATFTGSFTDPAGVYDANYTWVWTATGPNGDNHTLSGTSAQPGAVGDFKFIPASKGVYSVSLRVTDADGGTTLAQSAQMLVTSVPVVTSINSGPSSGSEGTAVSFTGSFTDPVGTRAGGYRVRWTAVGSNGQSEASESLVTTPGASSFTFTPRSGATYTVQMSVNDADNTTTSSTQTLTVANVAPTAAIVTGPTTSVEGAPVSFAGNFSDPGLAFDGPYTYNWTATGSNGQTATAQGAVTGPGAIPAFAVTPNDNGTYTITLTVQDRDGLTSTATRTLVVANVAPTATFTSPGKIAQGNAATFTFGNAADASSVDAAGLTYSYDFTNSGTFTAASASASASHIFAETGTYTVRGRVTDKDGAFTDYTTTIKVGARDVIVAGAGPGGGPHVRELDAATGAEMKSFFAYDPAFRGGVSVASGDVNGDGVADIVTAVASGGGPHVKVFDGVSGQVIASFYAFDAGFGGGVTVAVGDINNDGRADIVVGTGPSAAPHVKVIDARKLDLVDNKGTIAEAALLQSFYAFDKGFGGGVTVASGDIDKDGFADVVVGAGAGGGPAVGVYSGATGKPIASFYAFDPLFFGGVNVAVGDLNGDGFGDIIVGAGPGAGARVIGIDGTRLGEMLPNGVISENALLRSFMAYDASFRAGVRVGAADRDGDGISEILTGPQGSSSERVFAYSGKPTQPKEAFDVFAGFNGGVSLG